MRRSPDRGPTPDYQQADLALQAAALVHGIAEGQVFVEGNKRTGTLVMLNFLSENGYRFVPPDEGALATWVLRLSTGLTVEGFADLLRPCLVGSG